MPVITDEAPPLLVKNTPKARVQVLVRVSELEPGSGSANKNKAFSGKGRVGNKNRRM